MAVGLTRQATGNGLRGTERLAVALADRLSFSLWPNKPVLPTATTWLTDDSLGSGRRQTGQSLGLPEKRRGNELRRAKCGPRSAGHEL
jgi:hypothetical protein